MTYNEYQINPLTDLILKKYNDCIVYSKNDKSLIIELKHGKKKIIDINKLDKKLKSMVDMIPLKEYIYTLPRTTINHNKRHKVNITGVYGNIFSIFTVIVNDFAFSSDTLTKITKLHWNYNQILDFLSNWFIFVKED